MKTKTFDCVQMKRIAAARIYEALKGMTPEQETEFWREKNAEFVQRQEERRHSVR